MTGRGPVEFTVDLEQLAELRHELSVLAGSLAALDSHGIHADGEALGSHDVAAAVDRFIDRWGHGRRTIADNLTACQRIVEEAIEGYGTIERQLECAAAPTTPGPNVPNVPNVPNAMSGRSQ